MRVAAVQFKPHGREGPAAVARIAALLEPVGDVDLIVLPEMFATGYVFDGPDEVRAVAEPADGPTSRAISALATSRRAWVVAGFPERDGDALYNAAWVVDRDGRRADVYRKTLLFDADVPWATPGPGAYRTFATGAGRFSVGICMDLNDDRFVWWNAVHRPDVIAFPTNWLEEGIDVHPYWNERIAPTGAALVAANTYGPERGYAFRGRSAIVRRGRVLAAAPEAGDAVITATVGR